MQNPVHERKKGREFINVKPFTWQRVNSIPEQFYHNLILQTLQTYSLTKMIFVLMRMIKTKYLSQLLPETTDGHKTFTGLKRTAFYFHCPQPLHRGTFLQNPLTLHVSKLNRIEEVAKVLCFFRRTKIFSLRSLVFLFFF